MTLYSKETEIKIEQMELYEENGKLNLKQKENYDTYLFVWF